MTGKQLAKSIAAAALALTVIFTVPAGVSPARADSLSDMRGKQSSLKTEQSQIEAKLAQLKNDKAKQTEYVESLNAQVQNTEAQIDNLTDQINSLNADILEKQNQIAGKQKEIDANVARLKERIYALYLTGEASNLEIVLNAKNIMDLADKTELIKVISEHDTALINSIKTDMESIKTQKAEIETNKKAATASKTELDKQRSVLSVQQAEAQKALAALSATEQAELKAKASNAAEQKENEAAIDEWFANYYAEQRRKQQQSGGSTGGSTGNYSYHGTGTFTWPVPSYSCISQYYGSYAMGSFHKGVDIAASYGTPIVAADGGTVVASIRQDYHGAYGGYGNVVVIDHGNGYTTLYAHMSSRAVSEGETVAKGQVIGYVGSTGQSTGNHCHFEIRKDGSTTNPMGYFG